MMKQFAQQVCAASVLIIFCGGIFGTIVTQDMIGVFFSMSFLLFGVLFNGLEKTIAQRIGPDVASWKRPNPPSSGCGVFANQAVGDMSFGMPSGHAQAAGFGLMFWVMYLRARHKNDPSKANPSILALATIALIICISRYENGCHNVLQIGTGFLIGAALGYFSFVLCTKMNLCGST